MSPNATTTRMRRAVAAAGALTLAFLGVFGLAGSASAAPIGGVGSIVSPDPVTSSIIVHKYEKAATNGLTAGDGTPTTPTGNTINGVTFKLQEVVTTPGNASLNLLTNAGWTTASSIQSGWSSAAPTTLPAGYTLTTGTTQVTAGAGLATFSALHYGLYLVTEMTTPALPAQVIDPALPFLVTVPFPTGANHPTNPNEWLYAVNVYPKNSVTGLTKVHNPVAVDTGYYTAGDYVSWTVTSNVPSLVPGGSYSTYTIVDTINPAQLKFPAGAPPAGISPRSIAIFNGSNTNVTASFTLTTDYTFTISGASNEIQTLAFTAAGRTKMASLAQGGRVVWVVPTQVVTIPANGNISNGASSVVNSSNLNAVDPVDFGQLRIFKFSPTDPSGTPTKTPLAGASFQLYNDANSNGTGEPGELVTVNGVSTFTTDNSGVTNVLVLKPGNYLVVETVAPVGYQLNAAPHPVTVVAGTTVVNGANYIEIQNSQLPPWALAFTGGNGVLMFSIGGGALMVLAIGIALVARRRRETTA